jgi:hypothetical protein
MPRPRGAYIALRRGRLWEAHRSGRCVGCEPRDAATRRAPPLQEADTVAERARSERQ